MSESALLRQLRTDTAYTQRKAWCILAFGTILCAFEAWHRDWWWVAGTLTILLPFLGYTAWARRRTESDLQEIARLEAEIAEAARKIAARQEGEPPGGG